MSRIIDTIRQRAPAGDDQAPLERAASRGGRRKGRPELGAVQYFHMADRGCVERALELLDDLPIRYLRTSISWCDWMREGGEEWYAWLIPTLTERVSVLPCFLYTPPALGLLPKTSSPPKDPEAYGEFVEMVLRSHPGVFPYVELWNEPNNYIEWDWTIDPEWQIFARMIAGAARRAAQLGVRSVLGGMSPFDPNWLDLMFKRGALEDVDVIGVHGFPGTWEAVWDGWDVHVERVLSVLARHGGRQSVWVTEAGYSTWGHDEFGQLRVLSDLVDAPADRVYWYSVEDLAPEHETLDGFHCDERAYHFGMCRHGGQPKLLARVLSDQGVPGVRELVRFASEPTLGSSREREARGSSRPARALSAPRRTRRVLVTGGAGFIGTNLANRLASGGTPVTILDTLARAGVEENLRWLKHQHQDLVRVEVGDVRDRFAVRRAMRSCDRVFHLAAQVAVTTSLLDPLQDLEVNARGTVNVLEEARRLSAPPAIVFTSTNKVYGSLENVELAEDGPRHEPVDPAIRRSGISEEQPLDFCSPYGCSKGAADQYVLDYASSFSLPACVFRMSCIYGPHQKGTEDQGWVAHFLINALAGRPITIFGDGRQTRDLLYVDDLVDALLAASANERALSGLAFNIGGGPGNAASLVEVVEIIAELVGEQPPLLWDGWRVADQRYYASDVSRFARLTGWKPRVPIESGLSRLHEWLTDAHRARPAAVAARS